MKLIQQIHQKSMFLGREFSSWKYFEELQKKPSVLAQYLVTKFHVYLK